MEPTIRNISEARALLAEVRRVAEPLQRGDIPYDFSTDEIKTAHSQAALIVSHMTRELRNIQEAIDHRDAEVLTGASSYLRTLSYVLLGSDDISDQEKMVLDFCAVATSFVSGQIIKVPDGSRVLVL